MAGRSRTKVPAVVYKDFQPQIDRKEEQGANILVLHLPDFPKEQVKVTYVDATRSIKVEAEKAVEKNTRSRINQSFPVPENCIVEKIQGSLRNGVLTITMPRRTVTHHPLDSPEDVNVPKPKASASASASTSGVEKERDQKMKTPPKPTAQPKPPVATTAPKPTSEPKPPAATVAPKPTSEPKPPAATVASKPTSEPKPPAATVAPKPISESKPPAATVAPKPTSEPKPPAATVAPKPISESKPPAATVAPKPISEPKPPASTVAPKPISEPKPPIATAPQIPKEKTEGKEFEALPPSKQQEKIQRKVSPIAKQTGEEKAGGSMHTTPEIVEKKGETKDGLKDLDKEKAKDSMPEAADIPKATEKAGASKKKPKEGGGGFLEMKGMGTIMKTVKRLGTDDAEDRQLLIKVGVSALVIVAFGAYITYRYRSSGKPKS